MDRPIEPPRRDENQIAEEAARWFEALKTAGTEDHAAFATWLRQSSRHVHYFLRTTALDTVLERVDPERRFDIQALVKEAQQNIVPFAAGNAGTGGRNGADLSCATATGNGRLFRLNKRWLTSGRAAAGVAALLIVALGPTINHLWGWKEFTTRIGEQRAVELEDGSLVHLNTGSRLQVRLSDEARDIRLLRGEALFKVHQDARRPFRVHANGSIIQAVGTQFNVYRRPQDTKVSVLEGKVRISLEDHRGTEAAAGTPLLSLAGASPTSLTAGEEAEIKHDGQVRRRPSGDLVSVVAWRQRRLVFRADALSDVIAEFNRYNRAPKIRLEGLDGNSRHYTGTFDADDPEAFAVVLSQEDSILLEHTAREIIIRPRLVPASNPPASH